MSVNAKTIFVRNTQPGPTVFDIPDFPTLKWEGAGDPAGGDVLPISASILDDSQFQRCHYLGVLEIVEADSGSRSRMDQHAKAWQRQTQRMREITGRDLGQPDTEIGSVAQDAPAPIPRPKAQVGPGAIPKTLEQTLGVDFENGVAKPKNTAARVKLIVSEAGDW